MNSEQDRNKRMCSFVQQTEQCQNNETSLFASARALFRNEDKNTKKHVNINNVFVCASARVLKNHRIKYRQSHTWVAFM